MLLSCTIVDFHFFIFKHEPLWQEVSVKSLILGWPLRPVDLLFWFDIDLPFLTRRGITIYLCVANIHDPDTTLKFDLKVKSIGFLTCFCVQPIPIFDLTLAYHIWHMGLSPWEDVSSTFMILYDVDLWPQHQIYRVYDIALSSGFSLFVLWHTHTLFGTWVNHHGTMCHIHTWTMFDLDLWLNYQN